MPLQAVAVAAAGADAEGQADHKDFPVVAVDYRIINLDPDPC